MTDLTAEIRDIYRRWLDGGLSQEDALFRIGDVLDQVRAQGRCGPEAVVAKSAAACEAS